MVPREVLDTRASSDVAGNGIKRKIGSCLMAYEMYAFLAFGDTAAYFAWTGLEFGAFCV